MSNSYHNGDKVHFSGTFTDSDNVVHDPENVFFQIKNPSDTIVLYQYGVDAEVVKHSTGIYYVDLPLAVSGWWYYRWYSTGVGMAADEGGVFVERSKFV